MTTTITTVVQREPSVWARLSPRTRRALAIGGALVLVLLALRTFVVRTVEVDGGSMEPTFGSGTWVIVDTLTSGAEHGNVIVFDAPPGSGATHGELVKRVVATAGEQVALRGCVVFVDDVALDEPYVLDEPTCGVADVAEITVPDGAVFVLGDHRSDSLDSRAFGPVPVDSVHGRVRSRLWPF